MFVNDQWGSGIADNFSDEFKNLGGIILDKESFLQSEKDFRTNLLKIKNNRPSVLMLSAYPDQVGIISKQVLDLGINVQLAAYRGSIGDETIELGGAATNNLIFLEEFDIASNRESTKRFTRTFKEKYNKNPNLFAAMGYDAYNLYVDAVKKCGESTDCIRDYFYSTKNYEAASALITFDEKGDVLKNLGLMKIKDGKFVPYE